MAKYIEREALLKEMLDFHSIPVYIGHVSDEDIMFENMVEFVKEQPTADVVEVVRCKDCKHAYINSFSAQSGVALCKFWSNRAEGNNLVVQQDDYCSYGERKCDNGKQ